MDRSLISNISYLSYQVIISNIF